MLKYCLSLRSLQSGKALNKAIDRLFATIYIYLSRRGELIIAIEGTVWDYPFPPVNRFAYYEGSLLTGLPCAFLGPAPSFRNEAFQTACFYKRCCNLWSDFRLVLRTAGCPDAKSDGYEGFRR